MIGSKLAHYTITGKLGEGGMGVVYEALDGHLDRAVALKLLPHDALANPTRKQRFVQEAKAASALNHPHIVTIYDIGCADGTDYMAMELIRGRTLEQVLSQGKLRLAEVLKYGVQIADALAAAHSARIVHRDLKPGNIMITERGDVKVLDFGLAKLTGPADTLPEDETLTHHALTEAGFVVGSVPYMSPEQAEGRNIDARSDIFSFGSVLYEMTTGHRAFRGDTNLSTLAAIGRDEPKPVSERVREVPRDLEKIINRCLRKDLEYRFQHIADVKVALRELKEESDSGKLPPVTAPSAAAVATTPARPHRLAWIGGAALLITIGGALLWMLQGGARKPSPASNPILTRVTADSGLTTDPALSPDSKLVAYASDRGGQGNLNIWLKQVGGGEGIQLTHSDADDHDPVFSPDGKTIAFRSEREGGGIYTISTLGGEARKIAPHGRNPRFSPDGNWIAYWVGSGSGGRVASQDRLSIVPANGGPAKLIHAEFPGAFPVWSPDGKRLIFFGLHPDAKLDRDERSDWWSASLEGGEVLRTGAMAALGSQKLSNPSTPEAWLPGGYLVFSANAGDTRNLWKIPISLKTWRVTGPAEQVTSGTTLEVKPSVAIGPDGMVRVAFTSLISNVDIWELPIDAQSGKVSGEARRLTEDAADDTQPAISVDGKKLAYVSMRSGNRDIWVKDLRTGKETPVTATPNNESFPAISLDGRLAYGAWEGQKRSIIYAAPMPPRSHAGALEALCDDCGNRVNWSPDGTKFLYLGNQFSGVYLWDIVSRQKTLLVANPGYSFYEQYFSPDGRWISFNATTQNSSRIFAAPFRGPQSAPQSEWVALTNGDTWDDNPRWSPDGKLLYFTSDDDGFRCILARRLDPNTKQPQGPPISIYHAHHARRSLLNVDLGGMGISVARDRIVFTMGERNGNIWITQFGEK